MSKQLRRRLNRIREEIQIAAAHRDEDRLYELLLEAEKVGEMLELEEGQTSLGVSALTKEKIQSDFERHYGNNSSLTAPCPKVTGHRRQEPSNGSSVLEALAMVFMALVAFAFCAIMWLADKG